MRYKKHTRAEIDKAIRDAKTAGMSEKQTIQYIIDKTGIKIGHAQLVDRRRELRLNAIKLWNTFRRDDYEYRLRHLDRIAEIELVVHQATQKVLEYVDDPKKFFQWKAAAYTLMDASERLDKYDIEIKEIDMIGAEYENEMDETVSKIQPEEQGTISTQKGRVF